MKTKILFFAVLVFVFFQANTFGNQSDSMKAIDMSYLYQHFYHMQKALGISNTDPYFFLQTFRIDPDGCIYKKNGRPCGKWQQEGTSYVFCISFNGGLFAEMTFSKGSTLMLGNGLFCGIGRKVAMIRAYAVEDENEKDEKADYSNFNYSNRSHR